MKKKISETIRRLKGKLIYRVTLFFNILRSSAKKKEWPWWSQIDDYIVLGAIPLKNKGHLEELKEEFQIKAVLTLLEPFEWESQGPLSSPVTPNEWKALQIAHHHIHAKDFGSLTPEQIDAGVEFIHSQVKQGNRVYVHCKAGRGRSASVVACYLLKHGNIDSVTAALDFIRQHRPQIAINDLQMQAINAYYDSLNQKGSL